MTCRALNFETMAITRQRIGEHLAYVLQTKVNTWKGTHPLSAAAAAAAAKIGASTSSSSSLLYMKRSCLPERRSNDVVVTLDRRRSRVLPTMIVTWCLLFHSLTRIFRRMYAPREAGECAWLPILDSTRQPRRKLHGDHRMNGPVGWMARERQTGEAARAKSRRRLARFRVSDPSDNRPAGTLCTLPHEVPLRRPRRAVILRRVLIRAPLRIATARRATLPNDNKFPRELG